MNISPASQHMATEAVLDVRNGCHINNKCAYRVTCAYHTIQTDDHSHLLGPMYHHRDLHIPRHEAEVIYPFRCRNPWQIPSNFVLYVRTVVDASGSRPLN